MPGKADTAAGELALDAVPESGLTVAEVARGSDTGSAAHEPLKMDGASAGETGSGVGGPQRAAARLPRP
ncbi:hypothetical protein, partial [Paraburkholderia graminis]|uniref:hypothetical protein n=1 Tax=Paraburkholderia graminis TaxID=60548 RepID=UPI0038BC4C8A